MDVGAVDERRASALVLHSNLMPLSMKKMVELSKIFIEGISKARKGMGRRSWIKDG